MRALSFVAGGAAAGFLLWVALRRSEDAPEQEEPTREARGRLEAGS
jgi:hypothetical protein